MPVNFLILSGLDVLDFKETDTGYLHDESLRREIHEGLITT